MRSTAMPARTGLQGGEPVPMCTGHSGIAGMATKLTAAGATTMPTDIPAAATPVSGIESAVC